MSEKVRMTENRILIDPGVNQDHSDGGIFVGDPTTTFTQTGRPEVQITHGQVVSVGPGKVNKRGIRHPVAVEPGQYVAFSDTCHRHAGIPDKDYIIIQEDDVALVSDEPFNHVEVMY